MKRILLTLLFCFISTTLFSQTLVGKWMLVSLECTDIVLKEAFSGHRKVVSDVISMDNYYAGLPERLIFTKDSICNSDRGKFLRYTHTGQTLKVGSKTIKVVKLTDSELELEIDAIDHEVLRDDFKFEQFVVRVKYKREEESPLSEIVTAKHIYEAVDGDAIEVKGEVAESKISDSVAKKVFDFVEVPPRFPGGEGALYQFIVQNLKYPAEPAAKGIEGKAICRFVVMADGSVSNVKVLRGIDPLLNDEAVRVLKLMPKWLPGQQGGKNVNVNYTIPIVFKLAN